MFKMKKNNFHFVMINIKFTLLLIQTIHLMPVTLSYLNNVTTYHKFNRPCQTKSSFNWWKHQGKKKWKFLTKASALYKNNRAAFLSHSKCPSGWSWICSPCLHHKRDVSIISLAYPSNFTEVSSIQNTTSL